MKYLNILNEVVCIYKSELRFCLFSLIVLLYVEMKANPYEKIRWYWEWETIDSIEIDWYTFYKVQSEDEERIAEIREEMEWYDTEEDIIQAMRDEEAIILTLHWDTEITEEAYQKALER